MKGLQLIHCIILSVYWVILGGCVVTTQHLFFYLYPFPSSIYIWIAVITTCKLCVLSFSYITSWHILFLATTLCPWNWNIHWHLKRINANKVDFYCLQKQSTIVSHPTSDSIIVSWDCLSPLFFRSSFVPSNSTKIK